MNTKRPVNLDLWTIQFPPMAIASILHRISGVVLFIFFPVLLYFLATALKDAQAFQSVQQLAATVAGKGILFCFSLALIYHFFAGIRHLIMDLGFGEGLVAGRRSALFVMFITLISAVWMGVWLW